MFVRQLCTSKLFKILELTCQSKRTLAIGVQYSYHRISKKLTIDSTTKAGIDYK
jgi:hypothetical protein